MFCFSELAYLINDANAHFVQILCHFFILEGGAPKEERCVRVRMSVIVTVSMRNGQGIKKPLVD